MPHVCQSGRSAEERPAGRNKVFSGGVELGEAVRGSRHIYSWVCIFQVMSAMMVIMGCTPTDSVNSRLKNYEGRAIRIMVEGQ